jgi:D-aminopeptidase
MPEGALHSSEMGSVIVILATDAPLSGLSLRQMAKRAAIGIGRGGTPGGNNSGDIFLAFSTANEGPMPQFAPPVLTKLELNIERLDPLDLAAVEAVEEAVVNALVAGEAVDTVKPSGHVCQALDTRCLRKIFGL